MNRVRHGGLIAGLLIGIVLNPCSSEAQYTSDFQTNIIDGVTSNWTGGYYVGYTNFADVLIIQNNASFPSGAILGWGTGSSNNCVLVTGGSTFGNPGAGLFVGYQGAGNSLLVSGGSQFLSGYYYSSIGDHSSSSNNIVTVTGTGSLWQSQSIYVGNLGAANTLVISNGGMVTAVILLGVDSSSCSNSLFVTGTGSVWSNGMFGGLLQANIGYNGPGNRVVISDGGHAVNTDGYEGLGTSSSNNSVLVTDSGSFWESRDSLTIGLSGRGNSLIVSNGGRVTVGSDASVGTISSSSGNSVVVTGEGSVWSNRDLYIGYSGPSNNLVINNGGRVINRFGYVGISSVSNTVLVSDPGSVWTCSNTLYVGYGGSGNNLIISNGGQVICGKAGPFQNSAYVGFSSNSNKVVVTGSGSVWSNGGNLFTDNLGGSSTTLIISDGGQVISATGSASRVLVTGTNSL